MAAGLGSPGGVVGPLLLGLPDAGSATVLASSFPLLCGDLTLAPGPVPSALLAGSWPTCPYEDTSLTSRGRTVVGTSYCLKVFGPAFTLSEFSSGF